MEYSIIKAMLGQYLGNIAIISRHPFFKGGRMKFDFELQGGGGENILIEKGKNQYETT